MRNFINQLSRRQKRMVFLCLDVGLVPFATYLAFSLRFGTLVPWDQIVPSLGLVAFLGAVAICLALVLKTDRIKLHVFDTTAVVRIGFLAVLLTGVGIVARLVFGLETPVSVPLIFGALYFSLSIGVRNVGLWGLHLLDRPNMWRDRVVIYGAGSAGIQLVAALRQAHEVNPIAFVDDNASLHGTIIAGLEVMAPNVLDHMARQGRVDRVLLAIPSLGKDKQSQILGRLSNLPGKATVQVLPSYVEMIADGADAKPVAPEALLGRDKVDLDIPDIARTYAGRSVMVTGAGGSIGSELCRQLLGCNPARIVLFEQGELNLYEIDRELRPLAEMAGIELVARLGSVTNRPRVEAVLAEQGVHVVFHAAAYKHVPLVEDNELEGARNNVLGTQIVAEAAGATGVERFILVSTDKAVRPTNIMGATKRMAELVIQDLQTRPKGTLYAMVRFGNVLGSSGSVLPLFQKQIVAGGPVTVTHPEVTRFFMTIPEAARLVLLAGSYARGGDVFVLNMGEPRKIYDIACRMIELSGQHVRGPGQNTGIEIKVTGLRPGEKLYEELLIDHASLVGTPHPKILCAQEAFLSEIEVKAMLKDIGIALSQSQPDHLRQTVKHYVHGYHEPHQQGPKQNDAELG